MRNGIASSSRLDLDRKVHPRNGANF